MKALIFPGQGSQKVGMAKALVEKFSWAADLAETADSILQRSISHICFDGPEEDLKRTVNTQPAIFLASAIMTEWLRRNNVKFDLVAGHSLGEYNALFAAGVASFEDLVRLVDLRANAMENACPAGIGAMSAVMMLGRDELEKICAEVSSDGICVIANYNCPGQLVISGHAAAVKKAGELSLERGARKVVALDVSGPFHSPLMSNARERLAAALDSISFADAQIPVFTNIDASPTQKSEDFKEKLLKQITGSVFYEDSVKNMISYGVKQFVEVGPGKVLSALNKKIDASVPTLFASDAESLQALLSSMQAA